MVRFQTRPTRTGSKPCSELTKMKLSNANGGENNGNWKGDKVGYNALHDYIKRHLPKSDRCQICKQIMKVELANKSGKYMRDLTDWYWLCRRCHIFLDKHRHDIFT